MLHPEATRITPARIAASLLLPVAAAALQWLLWDAIGRQAWFLLYPAVFVAILVGRFWGGASRPRCSRRSSAGWYSSRGPPCPEPPPRCRRCCSSPSAAR